LRRVTFVPTPRQGTTLLLRGRLSSLVACLAGECSVGSTQGSGYPLNIGKVHFEANVQSRLNRSVGPYSVVEEFSLKQSVASHQLQVQAFLILEKVPGSKELAVSVLLQADGRFIGKTSLGIVAEGQEILLSLRWDQPTQRFVASSQAAGSVPILSFIPFALPGAAHDLVPPEFSMARNIAPKLDWRDGD
jgi:hypothetical protein